MAKTALIESSVVRSAIGIGSTAQKKAIEAEAGCRTLSSLTYIRMEFIRSFLQPLAQMAGVFTAHRSIREATNYLSQHFAKRQPKEHERILGIIIDKATPPTPTSYAEACVSIAEQALRKFDKVFAHIHKNHCGCKIGSMKFRPRANNRVEDLLLFVQEFDTGVSDCEISDWLQLDSGRSATRKLLAAIPPSDRIAAVDALREIWTSGERVNCGSCRRIGDAVIALEQPMTSLLIHCDAAFDTLSEQTGKDAKKVGSVTALDRESIPDLPPLN